MKNLSRPKSGTQPRALDRVTFGRRLRTARERHGWTLSEVAEKSGVSITTISRAERGQLALSYEKFSALGRALLMDLGEMFAEVGATTSRLVRPVVTRAGEGVAYRGLAVTYQFLGTKAVGKQMNPILGTVHARSIGGPEHYARHEGEEFIYILSGEVEAHFEDGQVIRLARGDSLYFNSSIGHAYISVSRKLARTIAACTSESNFMKLARERDALEAGQSRAGKPKRSRRAS